MNELQLIQSKVYEIRGQKVMIDRYLSEMYGVETRALNQAVKRNIDRFPKDFMFQLKDEEFLNWKSQFVITNSINMGIMRTFVSIRQLATNHPVDKVAQLQLHINVRFKIRK